MAKKAAKMGMNRTGIGISPMDSKKLIAQAESVPPSSAGDDKSMEEIANFYLAQEGRVGTVPIPDTLKGVAKATLQKFSGHNPEVFIDKLGQRLVFERTGTRLYDALIDKCEIRGKGLLGNRIDDLKHFRDEEARHFELLKECVQQLGADPTAVTPCADTAAVASTGILQVITDPRTTVAQSLEAILVAELVDHDGWELLIQLADGMGQKDMADRFREALSEETIHLQGIRGLVQELTFSEAKTAAA